MRLHIDSSIRANPRAGLAISAGLHAALVLTVFLAVTQPTPSKPKPRQVPVEIVPPSKAPPKKTAKKPPETAKADSKKAKRGSAEALPAKKVPPKPPEQAEVKEEKVPVKNAEKLKPAKKPAEPKEAKKPEPQIASRPQKTPPQTKAKPVEPAPFTPIPAPSPLARPLPKPPPPKPSRPRASAPNGVKVPAQTDGVPLPGALKRAPYGRWVLDPLILNAGHQCGSAGITGSIRLTKKRGNRYVGSLRRTIQWSRCKSEGAVYNIVLIIRGQNVTMLASGTVLDRGTISGNKMVLKDAYGASTWRRVR